MAAGPRGPVRRGLGQMGQDQAEARHGLARGAEKARDIAMPVLKRMRKAAGIDR